MDSSASPASPAISPSSDQKFWSELRSRVDTILERRKRHADWSSSSSTCGAESRRGKRIREDSLLLIRGLDSVASSLSHLKETLDGASQGVENLVQPTLTATLKREERGEVEENTNTETLNRPSLPDDATETRGSDDKQEVRTDAEKEEEQKICKSGVEASNLGTLKKAKNLAICMLSKATSLARQLKAVKSELGYMRGRCDLLEEENRRIRCGIEKGSTQDEDDLVRLQMEALLAEKSKLAHENANLMRENERLQQLVEYHQLTAQDLAETYGNLFHGVRLDFSSDSEDECNLEDRHQHSI